MVSGVLDSKGARQIGQVLSLRVVAFVVAMASSVIVARILGPEERGVLAAAFALPGVIGAFVPLGFPSSNVYFLNQSRNPAVLLLNGLIFCLVVSLISVVVVGVVVWFGYCSVFYEGITDFRIVLLALSTVILTLFRTLLQQFLRGLHLYRIPVASRILHEAIRLSAILALLFFLVLDVNTVIVVTFLTLLTIDGYLFWVVLKRVSILGTRPDFRQFMQSMWYSLRLFLGVALNTLNTRIDTFVLVLFLDKKILGIYVVGAGLAEIASFIPWAVGYVLYPKLSQERDDVRKQQVLKRCIVYTALLLVLLWIMFVLFGRWVIVLAYGLQYRESHLVASILMIGTMLLSASTLIGQYFKAGNRPEITSVARALNLPIKAATLYFLCRYYGVIGASLSFAISSCTLLLITLAVYQRIARRDRATTAT